MYLDPRTVIIINIFSAALLGIALLAVSRGYLKQIPSIFRWAVASLLHAAAWILYSLWGVVPNFISIILGMTALLWSLGFYYQIIAEFTGKIKRIHWVYYVNALSVAGLAYFLWVKPDTSVRIVIVSIASAVFLFGSSFLLLVDSKKRPSSHIFTGLVFGFSGLILLFRAGYFLFWDTNPNQTVFTQNAIQSVTFLTSYLTAAMITFGFLLMSYDRYITQHEKAEDEIILSEKRLNEAQKLAKLGSWEFDLNTNELTWSKEQYRIFDLDETAPDKLYELCRTRIHPDDIAQMDESIRISKEKGQGVTYEHRVICSDGSIKYLLGKGETFKSGDGTKNMLRGTVQDVTEIKLAEKKILSNKRRLNEAQKLAKIGSWELNLETLEQTWSDEHYRIFELEDTPADKLFKANRAKIHPDDIPMVDSLFAAAIEKGEPIAYEYRVLCNDGSIKNVSGKGETFLAEDNKAKMMRGTVQDITERKKNEQLLKEFEHFFYNSNDLSCIANQKGYFEIINSKFEKLLGYSEKALIESSFLSFIHADDIAATNRIMETLETGATVLNFVNRYKKKDGEYLWLEWAATPDEATGKIYAIAHDITGRKKAEETNRKFAILESKSKEMEQFAYIASHDLREPLLTIKNYADLFTDEYAGKLDKDSSDYLHRISQAAGRMDELIKGLLDYSRLSKLKELQQVDSNVILQEVLADLNSLIVSSGVNMTTSELPVVNAYPMELKQLFQNLLTNAIKFKKNGINSEICISCEKIDGVCTFRVEDNGIGIEDTDKEKIFGLFQRVNGRNSYPGSGIGLAYCKKIVELHHGNIWVESVFGKGSSFYFTILT